jgi:hypothetical protein
MAGSCKYGNESSGSTKGGKILDQPNDYQLMKNSAPCSYFAFYFCIYLRYINIIYWGCGLDSLGSG